MKIEGKMLADVISMKPGRFCLFNANNRLVLSKTTTEKELSNFLKASRTLSQMPPIESPVGLLHISTPEFIEWNVTEKKLVMSFEEGLNLELILREANHSNRAVWVDFISRLFAWIQSTGFLWDDCCPRNIIFDKKGQRMIVVDFERGIQDPLLPVNDTEFAAYLRKTPLEEFCAFLFQEEQQIFRHAWDYEAGTHIELTTIVSKRRKLLLEKIFMYREGSVPIEDLVFVDKLMVESVTPFWWRNKGFFPLVYIDKAIENGDASKYVEIIMRYLALEGTEARAKFLETVS